MVEKMQDMAPATMEPNSGAFSQALNFHSDLDQEGFTIERDERGHVNGEVVLVNTGPTSIDGGVVCFAALAPVPCADEASSYRWSTQPGMAAVLPVDVPAANGARIDAVVTYSGVTPRNPRGESLFAFADRESTIESTGMTIDPSSTVFPGCDVATTVPFDTRPPDGTRLGRRFEQRPEQLFFLVERCDAPQQTGVMYLIADNVRVVDVDSPIWGRVGGIPPGTVVAEIPQEVVQDPTIHHLTPILLFADAFDESYLAGHSVQFDTESAE